MKHFFKQTTELDSIKMHRRYTVHTRTVQVIVAEIELRPVHTLPQAA